MRTLLRVACAVAAFALPCGGAAAQTHLPEGATIATDAKPLRVFTPPRNPGSTGFSAVDRLAIENLIRAYSLAYDNGQADAWLGLFTDDAVFVAGVPGGPAVAFSGEGFRAFWRERMKGFAASGNVRRHLMSNIVFIDQSDAAAHVSVVGLLANTSDGRTFSVVSSLNYEGWLVKGADGWKIARWHDFPDAPVGQ
ncbi:nuclear transport factor 2 family protein [Xanthobacter sp. DSM 14520]|uniref:nuclear transport factor 2 family protein n=1 Tax=Xanthobacter autotrophicus (strain ATCC BAA-1158 / Py2) TaxID=78245 RepID=UPI00372AF47E